MVVVLELLFIASLKIFFILSYLKYFCFFIS